MTEKLKTIQITLAGRKYPIVTTPEEEPIIVAMNKQLESEYESLRSRYASKLNAQDIVSMMLFQYAQKLQEAREENDLSEVENRIETIDKLLDGALGKSSD